MGKSNIIFANFIELLLFPVVPKKVAGSSVGTMFGEADSIC